MGSKRTCGYQHHFVAFLCITDILFSLSENKLKLVVFQTYGEMPKRNEGWSNFLRGNVE